MTVPCMILEWSDAAGWVAAGANRNTPRRIPAGRAPTVLQMDRATAEIEASRLAVAHPDKRFAIFAAVAVAKAVKLPTHTTLGGGEIGARRVPLLLEFIDKPSAADLEIPF